MRETEKNNNNKKGDGKSLPGENLLPCFSFPIPTVNTIRFRVSKAVPTAGTYFPSLFITVLPYSYGMIYDPLERMEDESYMAGAIIKKGERREKALKQPAFDARPSDKILDFSATHVGSERLIAFISMCHPSAFVSLYPISNQMASRKPHLAVYSHRLIKFRRV